MCEQADMVACFPSSILGGICASKSSATTNKQILKVWQPQDGKMAARSNRVRLLHQTRLCASPFSAGATMFL